jgi:hypothetical protein
MSKLGQLGRDYLAALAEVDRAAAKARAAEAELHLAINASDKIRDELKEAFVEEKIGDTVIVGLKAIHYQRGGFGENSLVVSQIAAGS